MAALRSCQAQQHGLPEQTPGHGLPFGEDITRAQPVADGPEDFMEARTHALRFLKGTGVPDG